MKKEMLISLLIISLLFSGCNQARDINFNGPSKFSFVSLTLLEAEHPELDFGISQHDGEKVIRDFAITENGNLLLLELSDKVYEYSPKGELLGSYDFAFDEQGLTAYMLTYDSKGNFYFVDGHNSLIIKADRNGILNIASFGEKSIVTEPGLIKGISASKENILHVVAISPGDFLTYTYELDVSGDNAICIVEPQLGISLGNGLSYQNELITNIDGSLTDGTSVTIYKDGAEKNKFEIHVDHFIFGLNIYGVAPNGGYFANIYEYLADGDTARETLVTLNEQGEVERVHEGFFKSGDIIRRYEDKTFVLRFNDDGVTVFPIFELFSTSKEDTFSPGTTY